MPTIANSVAVLVDGTARIGTISGVSKRDLLSLIVASHHVQSRCGPLISLISIHTVYPIVHSIVAHAVVQAAATKGPNGPAAAEAPAHATMEPTHMLIAMIRSFLNPPSHLSSHSPVACPAMVRITSVAKSSATKLLEPICSCLMRSSVSSVSSVSIAPNWSHPATIRRPTVSRPAAGKKVFMFHGCLNE